MGYYYNGRTKKKVISVVKTTAGGYYPINYFSFNIQDVEVEGVIEKHLIMSYCGNTPPAFSINEHGHLIYSGLDELDLKLDIQSGHLKWNL